MANGLDLSLVGLGQRRVCHGNGWIKDLEPECRFASEGRITENFHCTPSATLDCGDHLVDGHVIRPADDVDPGLAIDDLRSGMQREDDSPMLWIHVDACDIYHDRQRYPFQVVGPPHRSREPTRPTFVALVVRFEQWAARDSPDLEFRMGLDDQASGQMSEARLSLAGDPAREAPLRPASVDSIMARR